MRQKMTWEEMKQQYPDEWVAIVDQEGETDLPYGNIRGKVVAHNADEAFFTVELKKLWSVIPSVEIRFTGDILPENPVGPLLWQIINTTS